MALAGVFGAAKKNCPKAGRIILANMGLLQGVQKILLAVTVCCRGGFFCRQSHRVLCYFVIAAAFIFFHKYAAFLILRGKTGSRVFFLGFLRVFVGNKPQYPHFSVPRRATQKLIFNTFPRNNV